MPDSLQRLCGETETLAAARGEGLRCEFELEGNPAELPPQYSVTLLRAALASLANVRLHAKASTAVVTLAFLGDEVTLDVYDDGTGFEAESPGSALAGRADGSGFGLRSLARRSRGRLCLENRRLVMRPARKGSSADGDAADFVNR